MTDPWGVGSLVAAVEITWTVRLVTKKGKTHVLKDTLGLAIATGSGVQLAHKFSSPWYATIILGVITAVTGGLLRDVLCQLEPVLLHRETIATSSLCGAIAFVAVPYTHRTLPTNSTVQILVVAVAFNNQGTQYA